MLFTKAMTGYLNSTCVEKLLLQVSHISVFDYVMSCAQVLISHANVDCTSMSHINDYVMSSAHACMQVLPVFIRLLSLALLH